MISVEKNNNGAVIWLNRPEKKNALNKDMILRMMEVLNELENEDTVRYVVIRGKGEVFSAGADINWMKESSGNGKKDNYADAKLLATFFHQIYHYSKPTIAIVHGMAIGGAVGVMATCDIAYCSEETLFAFSEVKLGIIPATISPFILKRIREFYAKELMFTGRKFDGKEAERVGLVNKAFPLEQIDGEFQRLTEYFQQAGPMALKACKKLIYKVTNEFSQEELMEETSKIIAEIRTSEEAREGFTSFLEKRKPSWAKN